MNGSEKFSPVLISSLTYTGYYRSQIWKRITISLV